MRIRDRYTGGVRGSGPSRDRVKANGSPGASRVGEPLIRVQFSERGIDIQKARAAALLAPDVRQFLVDEIQGEIEQGRYGVTGKDVVPVMIREHLMGFGE